MKRRTVRDTRQLSQDPGDFGERLAQEEYGLVSVDTNFADLKAKTTDTLYEVKSAATEIGEKYREKGRFRLWEAQHNKLARRNRRTGAWYIFVLFDVSQRPPEAKLVRKDPADVGRKIAGRGGFGPSGHANKGAQHKLPYDSIF